MLDAIGRERTWGRAGKLSAVPSAGPWGRLGELTLAAALGLLLVAVADTLARRDSQYASVLLWLGVVVIFAPAAFRLMSDAPIRRERLALAAVLGLALYLVKVCHSPTAFTFHDELAHLRSAQEIQRSHHLFHENPLLPITAHYPGLEIVTNAVSMLTGLSLFTSGIVILAVARIVLVLALFLLFEQISRSPRLAGVAVMAYMGNPSFLLFDGQFSYESLALPLGLLGALATARYARRPRAGWLVVALLAIAATVTTHHITAYGLVGFLTLWAALSSRKRPTDPMPVLVLVFAATATGLWFAFVAPHTVEYLGPVLRHALSDALSLIRGSGGSRQLFTSAGEVAPAWERALGFAATGLVVLGLPFGLRRLLRGYAGSPLALALGVAALAYPFTLGLRLTAQGAETGARAAEFLFIGVGFALALAASDGWLAGRPTRWTPVKRALTWWTRASPGIAGNVGLLTATAAVTVVFVGGVIIGWAHYARLPGPYEVAAGPRSIEPESVAAARWTAVVLGPDHRFATDRSNGLLIGTYGDQHPVTAVSDHVGVWRLYFPVRLDPEARRVLIQGRIRYVQVDRRLAGGLPFDGVYFESGEPGPGDASHPLRGAALEKFDAIPDVSRIFDSGHIRVYDVRELSHVR
jgi:hypothetical protein